jgi:hypothetical protein
MVGRARFPCLNGHSVHLRSCTAKPQISDKMAIYFALPEQIRYEDGV